jgi:type I restriction enzyme S subunit
MSRIDDLIAEHCPNGVEFKALADVTIRGSNIRWANAGGTDFQYIDLTSVDRVTGTIGETATISADDAPSRAQQIVREGDVIFATTRPTQMRWAVIPAEFDGQIASTGYCVLRPIQNQVITNFLAHLLGTERFRKYIEEKLVPGNYPSIPDSRVREFRIPIPPLEVQREIVKVLDTFTKLEAELEAELEARRRQYQYYRDALLTFGERTDADASKQASKQASIRWATLGEVAEIGTGSHDTQDAIEDGDYIFYARGREPLKLNVFDFDETAIITAGDGAGVGKVFHYAQGKYALHQRAYRIVPGELMDPRFVYHCVASHFYAYIQKASVSSSVTSLRRPMFLNFPMPVPPLAEQERIVAILDKFDALVNDLSSGLPAEIKARRQQYEHYRDKLLSFAELEATA